MMSKHLKEQNPFNFIKFYYENCDKNKNYSIVTKCKYEFKNASNPCIITKRREENFSAQLFPCSCFDNYIRLVTKYER